MLVVFPGRDHMLGKVGKGRYAAFNGAGPGAPGFRSDLPGCVANRLGRLSSSRPARRPGIPSVMNLR